MSATLLENFKNLDLPPFLEANLAALNFAKPTEIQARAIPSAVEGRDILASAQTGSGKTMAFLIPLLKKLAKEPESRALVLVPTRELASQVSDNVELLIKNTHLKSAELIGGAPMSKQIRNLKRRPQIVVATPGRLIDMFDQGYIDLDKMYYLVLDEADRMLDMGFAPQLKYIREQLPESRQTLLFSATLPPKIQELAFRWLKNPVKVELSTHFEAAATIEQKSVALRSEDKEATLLKELQERQGLVLVFVKTQIRCDRVGKRLFRAGVPCAVIHGGLRQRHREMALEDFRSGRMRVLVATDVAARGLDIEEVQHVINYDLPMVPEDYIHRIGRTGRAGKSGQSLSFISPDEQGLWHAITRKQSKNGSDTGSSGGPRSFGRGGKKKNFARGKYQPQRHKGARPQAPRSPAQ